MPSPTPTQAPAITEINLSLHYGVVQRGTNSRWNNSGNFKLWGMGWDYEGDVQTPYTVYLLLSQLYGSKNCFCTASLKGYQKEQMIASQID